MTLELPASARAGHLIVAENWYPAWMATVNGTPAAVRRVQGSLIGVEIPGGAATVELEFRSRSFERGRLVSLLSIAAAVLLIVAPALRRRRPDA
jgi:uncharacterized membrane protein YfhO